MDYNELDKRYITREEFEKQWEEQKKENHTFWNSADLHLRNIEFQISQLKLIVDALKEMLTVKRESDNRIQDKINYLEKNDQKLNLDVVGTKSLLDETIRDLFGDTSKPDAPASVVGLMKIRSDRADAQHAELMAKVTDIIERVESVENFVALRRRIEMAAITGAKKIVDIVLSTTVGRIILIAVGSFLTLRVLTPDLMDQIGKEIIRILSGQP